MNVFCLFVIVSCSGGAIVLKRLLFYLVWSCFVPLRKWRRFKVSHLSWKGSRKTKNCNNTGKFSAMWKITDYRRSAKTKANEWHFKKNHILKWLNRIENDCSSWAGPHELFFTLSVGVKLLFHLYYFTSNHTCVICTSGSKAQIQILNLE